MEIKLDFDTACVRVCVCAYSRKAELTEFGHQWKNNTCIYWNMHVGTFSPPQLQSTAQLKRYINISTDNSIFRIFGLISKRTIKKHHEKSKWKYWKKKNSYHLRRGSEHWRHYWIVPWRFPFKSPAVYTVYIDIKSRTG